MRLQNNIDPNKRLLTQLRLEVLRKKEATPSEIHALLTEYKTVWSLDHIGFLTNETSCFLENGEIATLEKAVNPIDVFSFAEQILIVNNKINNQDIIMFILPYNTTVAGNDERFKKAEFSAKFLLNIINDVLDMSKIESGKMTFSHNRFHLQKILQEVTAIFTEQAKERANECIR